MAYETKTKKLKIDYEGEKEHLSIYKIKGKFYFLDKRLNEYRNIKKPYETIKMQDISLDDLQKPTAKDGKKLLGNWKDIKAYPTDKRGQ